VRVYRSLGLGDYISIALSVTIYAVPIFYPVEPRPCFKFRNDAFRILRVLVKWTFTWMNHLWACGLEIVSKL